MLTAFFSLLFGYLSGYLFRSIIGSIQASMGNCNIHKKGVDSRRWITIILLICGVYFEIPIILFFAGFTWYESQNKWCIVESVRKRK